MHEDGPAGQQPRQDDGRAVLQAARRAHAHEQTHQEPEIEGAEMHEHSLEDVDVPPQVRAPHRPGVVGVRKRALQELAATTEQGHAACPANAPAIRVDRVTGGVLPAPAGGRPVGFADVSAKARLLQVEKDRATVRALVSDDVVAEGDGLALRRRDPIELVDRFREGVREGRRIAA